MRNERECPVEDGDGVYAVVTFDERLGEFNGDKEMASAWRSSNKEHDD